MKSVRVIAILALILGSTGLAWASDNTTTTFSAITTNFGGSLIFPFDDTGTNNLLEIINGAVVIDTLGILGSSATANTNRAVVSGTGSTWTNTAGTSLIIGNNGSGNQLTITNNGKVVAIGDMVIGGTGHGNSTLVTGTGAVVQADGFLYVGSFFGTSNHLMVADGGRVNGFVMILGENVTGSTNNLLTVTGNGSVVSNTASLHVGRTAPGNRLVVSNGGVVVNNTLGLIGQFAGANSNTVLVTGNGSTWRSGSTLVVGGSGQGNQLVVADGGEVSSAALELGNTTGGYGNSMVVTNGGRYVGTGNIILGESVIPSASNNLLKVTGTGSMLTNAGGVVVGRGSANNQMIVDAGGQVLTIGGVSRIGHEAAADSNLVVVTDSGSVWSNTSTIVVGGSGEGNQLLITNGGAVYAGAITAGETSGNNSILVQDGGLLETAFTLSVPTASSISNRQGIYQFSTDSPSITGGGLVSITNGVIAYRAVDSANILNAQVGNITFAGENTFRLNSASNVLAASQNYTFESNGNPTNYVRLEMINGHTAYRGDALTIGATGSMLISNTRATITGTLTNLGTFTSYNSHGTFNGAVYNNGAWITDPTTNVFAADHTTASSGYFATSPDDVLIFQANYTNLSTQSTSYNTLAAKFLFNGVATTQRFYIAGKEMGLAPTAPQTTIRLPGNEIGFTNNFSIGTFEIANFSTVRVSDAFSLLGPGPDDGQRAALYVENLFMSANSFLIVDTNVTIYFKGSNSWGSANYLLLDDAELHQILIPEPSLLLLIVSGGVILSVARRKQN